MDSGPISSVLESGEGIDASVSARIAATFCRQVAPGRGRTEINRPNRSPTSPGVYKKNLEREVDRATALEEVDRAMQVDVVAGRQDESALRVVPGALQFLVTPLLDAIDLREVHELEFCRRHFSPPFRNGGFAYLAYSSSTTYRSSPFWGDFVEGP